MTQTAEPTKALVQNGNVRARAIETVVAKGDLSKLNDSERVHYYHLLCQSLGLNELTRPFEYLELDGKLVLYARKDCTDQLRKIHGVSITRVEKEVTGDLVMVTTYAQTADGRVDSDIGAVAIVKENGSWQTAQSGKRYFKGDGTFSPLTGEALANATMKAITKSKRRVTLSICGLGLPDESEVEGIPDARVIEVRDPARQALNAAAYERVFGSDDDGTAFADQPTPGSKAAALANPAELDRQVQNAADALNAGATVKSVRHPRYQVLSERVEQIGLVPDTDPAEYAVKLPAALSLIEERIAAAEKVISEYQEQAESRAAADAAAAPF